MIGAMFAITAGVVILTSGKKGKNSCDWITCRSSSKRRDSIVTTVYAGSTADKLGVKLGDQLVTVIEKPVVDINTLRSALTGSKVADAMTVEVVRDGKRLSLGPLPLGSR